MQLFSVGLGPAPESDVVPHHEKAPPRTPQEVIFTPFSAVVEMWDSALVDVSQVYPAP
jgi:hypothetical protein